MEVKKGKRVRKILKENLKMWQDAGYEEVRAIIKPSSKPKTRRK